MGNSSSPQACQKPSRSGPHSTACPGLAPLSELATGKCCTPPPSASADSTPPTRAVPPRGLCCPAPGPNLGKTWAGLSEALPPNWGGICLRSIRDDHWVRGAVPASQHWGLLQGVKAVWRTGQLPFRSYPWRPPGGMREGGGPWVSLAVAIPARLGPWPPAVYTCWPWRHPRDSGSVAETGDELMSPLLTCFS